MTKAILGVALAAIVGAAAWWLLGGGEAHAPDGAILDRRETPKPAVGPEKPRIAGAAGGVRSTPFTDAERAEAEALTSRATEATSGTDETGPFIRGRVVDATKKPVPMAEVAITIGTIREGVTRRVTADSAGRFREFSVRYPGRKPGEADSFSIEVAPPHGIVLFGQGRKYDLDPSAGFLADRDVGDLQVDEFRTLQVSVRNEAGAPVARGFLARDDAHVNAFVPLDAEANAKLYPPLAAVTILVAADGYERGRVTIPANAASPFVVSLQKAATVEVRVRTPSGAPAPNVSVRFFGPRGFMAFSDSLQQAVYDGALSDADEGSVSDAGKSTNSMVGFRTDAKGVVRVGDLVPGVPIKVEVTDPFATFSWLYDATPRVGEPVLIESKTSREPRTFAVIVMDAQGAPVRNASLDLDPLGGERPEARGLTANTGADGTASFSHVYAVEGLLTIHADALLKQRIDPFVFPGDGREAVVVLKSGRDVALEVVDPAGLPVPVEAAWVVHPDAGRSDGARAATDGRLVLKALPEDLVTITAKVGGEDFSMRHDARVPEARLVVPAHATLLMQLGEQGKSKDLNVFVRLTPLAGESPQRIFVPSLQGDLTTGELRIDAVRTGKYRAELLRDNGQALPTRIGAFVDFVVETGRTNEIRLSQ